MKTLTAALVFVMMVFIGGRMVGQNLVGNGSFEEFYSCPPGLNKVDSCIGWHHYGGIPYLEGTPDYFDSCTTFYQNAVPDNIFGSQVPFEGSAYMGLYTYVIPSSWYLEYIGSKLTDTLAQGNNYAVSMRVSRGDPRPVYGIDACIASSNMGIRLTTFPYSQSGGSIPANDFAQLYEDSVITDTTNWVLLHWNFIADSAYTYIYIGNFFANNSTDTLRIGCGNEVGSAYYYIDSVNFTCIDANCATGITHPEDHSFSISPNPFTTHLQLHYMLTQPGELMVYDALGRKVKSYTLAASQKTFELSVAELPAGVYLVAVNSGGRVWGEMVVKE